MLRRYGLLLLLWGACLMGCQGGHSSINPIYKTMKSETDWSKKPSDYCAFTKTMFAISWLGPCTQKIIPIDSPVAYDVFGLSLPAGYSLVYGLGPNGDDLGEQNVILLINDEKELQFTLSESTPTAQEYRNFMRRLESPNYAEKLLTSSVWPLNNPDVDAVSTRLVEITQVGSYPVAVIQLSDRHRSYTCLFTWLEQNHKVFTLQLAYVPMQNKAVDLGILKQEMGMLLEDPVFQQNRLPLTQSLLVQKFFQELKAS